MDTFPHYNFDFLDCCFFCEKTVYLSKVQRICSSIRWIGLLSSKVFIKTWQVIGNILLNFYQRGFLFPGANSLQILNNIISKMFVYSASLQRDVMYKSPQYLRHFQIAFSIWFHPQVLNENRKYILFKLFVGYIFRLHSLNSDIHCF